MDPNVQYFGAHTAHAKIARGELSSFPLEEQLALRDALVREAGVAGRARVVRRKIYGPDVSRAKNAADSLYGFREIRTLAEDLNRFEICGRIDLGEPQIRAALVVFGLE
ncbi:hypothetical protein B0H19DRAFT_1345979 [Mycena capillaripes]|nr:hypothetical protein B0H19DRAFT_1345979 [Mycena capillaripes]